MKKKNNKGFSLIELIIAIAILVILTGLLAPQFMKYIEKSREAKDMQTLDAVYSAVQGAFADEDAYQNFVSESADGDYKDVSKGMLLKSLAPDNAADTDRFAKELRTLLGVSTIEKDIKLVSKAAAGGEVGVAISYVEEKRDDDGNIEKVAGLEVAVYAAEVSDGKKSVGTLTPVGNIAIVPPKKGNTEEKQE